MHTVVCRVRKTGKVSYARPDDVGSRTAENVQEVKVFGAETVIFLPVSFEGEDDDEHGPYEQ
ncbi:hypothetical protein BFINE_40150 [Bacteroides finegoldii DSM 17565]|nr:hypothetical protein BFINE_40150 [Bacteroides finegoldii DSM 17565]GLL56557.1 hypothetical protein KUBF_42210 [Bacteroides finegoldii]